MRLPVTRDCICVVCGTPKSDDIRRVPRARSRFFTEMHDGCDWRAVAGGCGRHRRSRGGARGALRGVILTLIMY